MGNLADKYRDRVTKGTEAYRKSVQKQKELREQLEKEKKEAAERWKKQQAEMAAAAKSLEQDLLETWGSVVLSTGFADEYPDGFERLAEIIKAAMKKQDGDG